MSRTKKSDNKNDELPFGYMHPQLEDKLVWVCNYDQDQKLTSVFVHKNPDGSADKKIDYCENMEKAKYIRQQLIDDNWIKFEPPKVTVTTADGKEVPLNRTQKRAAERHLKKQAKRDNPFNKK